jgi:hypothetical protein
LSQLRRGAAFLCRADGKTLLRVRLGVSLMRGYRVTGKINLAAAEECLPADNEALSVGEQNLTECEQK